MFFYIKAMYSFYPASLLVDDTLDTGPEGLAGLGHHVLRQGCGLLPDGGDEGVLCCMGNMVGTCLKVAPEKIIHRI